LQPNWILWTSKVWLSKGWLFEQSFHCIRGGLDQKVFASKVFCFSMVKAASDVPAALAVSAEQDQETEGCEDDGLAPAFKRFWEVHIHFPYFLKQN
jgi:hypothetical protein